MTLRLLGHIQLPANRGNGGFDHADIHAATDRLYVAHTANDSIDIIDCATDRYIESVAGFGGVAGVLVSDPRALVFTSNRGENTVSVFNPGAERDAFKIAVGVGPNGLAFDPTRGILLAANVGDTSIPNSAAVSFVDIDRRASIAEFEVPGRTRWALHDATRERFYVNIESPATIITIDARSPIAIANAYPVPAAGPHGLGLDANAGRLFCACDAGVLFAMDADSGRVLGQVGLSGVPDVVFLHPGGQWLYVAIGRPGVIDVIDTHTMSRTAVVPTEAGAHTLAIDRHRAKLYAFLPRSNRAAVFHATD